MPKQPKFFCSQPSTIPSEALAKFYLSPTFGLGFMISSVAPTLSVDFLHIFNHQNQKPQPKSKITRWDLSSQFFCIVVMLL